MLTLMQRAGEQMNVPPDKVQKFLDDGWTIIQKETELPSKSVEAEPVEVQQTEAESEAEAVEEVVKATAKKSKKG